MKENVLDVLMYLFENYMDDEHQWHDNQELLKIELLAAGFPSTEISKALSWLEGLVEHQGLITTHHPQASSMRVYLPKECEKINLECRGFLLFLEQVGVLESQSREIVIDRVMALETEELTLEQLKWIMLMVLFNQPEQEAAFAWMEDLVFEEMTGYLH
ncbi:MAG: DUF494 family protein [Pseudomonadota bacterium]|nr:DUF494 family protein [Pseudomonadota bacterium]